MRKYKIMGAVLSLSILLSSCGAQSVGIIGNQAITKGEFEFYLSSVKNQIAGTETMTDEDWQSIEIDGKKAIEVAKEKTLETASMNVAYIEVAKKLNIKLNNEEKKSIKDYKESLKKSMENSGGYNKFLKDNNIDDKFVELLCESMEYSSKLSEKAAELNPISDEDLKSYFIANYRRAKHVLIQTMDVNTMKPYSEAEVAEAKAKADDIYKRALADEDFESLVEQYSQDPGSKSNPDGYIFADGEMMIEFQDGVDSVKVGGITIVETAYGYHIIKRYALDETPELYNTFFSKHKSTLESKVKAEKLTKQMEIWKSEFGIEMKKNDDVYNSIK